MNPAWFCAALSADLGTEEESKSHADLEERRGGDVMMFSGEGTVLRRGTKHFTK